MVQSIVIDTLKYRFLALEVDFAFDGLACPCQDPVMGARSRLRVECRKGDKFSIHAKNNFCF